MTVESFKLPCNFSSFSRTFSISGVSILIAGQSMLKKFKNKNESKRRIYLVDLGTLHIFVVA